MAVRLLPLERLTPADVDAWRALAPRAVEPNPFVEADFVLPAWRALQPRGVGLLVAQDEGAWQACLPVRRVPGTLGGLAGWRQPYSFLGTPLVDRADPLAAVSGLLERARRPLPGFLMLSNVGVDGPVGAALASATDELGLSVVWERRIERPVVRRNGAAPTGRSASRLRSDMRRRRRRLEEQLETPLVVENAGDCDGTVAEFLRLEAAGWKGSRGTAMAANGQHAAFFETMTRAFHAQGRLRLTVLRAQERTLAVSCDLIADDVRFGFKTTYDETYRRSGPGTILLHETIEAFYEDDAEHEFDSCAAAGSDLLERLMPERRTIASQLIGGRTVANPFVRRALASVDARRRRRAMAR
ncbi:MAG TPA: GNAT family N-acetyltransferase [Conexibacter sp.]|nr:GNAT family N-acetyltransferase [Conexibacter sp.]